MKRLVTLFFVCLSLSASCQVGNFSTQELQDYNLQLGVRMITKKVPEILLPGQMPNRRFFGNLTTDTLIAAISNYVRNNLILTPDGKIMVKPAQRIELYKNFTSEPETATNYTWKGKILYTQKFLINWASDDIALISGVDDLYYYKHIDASVNSNNGREERYVPILGPTIVYDPLTSIVKAYRPALTTGHHFQQAEIILQYTKRNQ